MSTSYGCVCLECVDVCAKCVNVCVGVVCASNLSVLARSPPYPGRAASAAADRRDRRVCVYRSECVCLCVCVCVCLLSVLSVCVWLVFVCVCVLYVCA